MLKKLLWNIQWKKNGIRERLKISNDQILFKIGEVGLDKVEEYKNAFYNSIK